MPDDVLLLNGLISLYINVGVIVKCSSFYVVLLYL